MDKMNRRRFLKNSVGAAIGTVAVGAATMKKATAGAPAPRTMSPNEKVIVGVMGLGGRGTYLSRQFARTPDVEVAYLCDANSNILQDRVKAVEQAQGKAPRIVSDFRRILEDRDVHALVVATPDHWHAPATILACQAGKDVYVEKPASHSIWEGRKAVEAARKYQRIVQLGTQNRSAAYVQHAIDYLRSGGLGSIHLVRVINMNARSPIAAKPDSDPPKGFDYDMWLGAAPMRPYNAGRVGRWNWFWDYSGGDIINDAVHQMDMARWVVGRPYPKAVTATGHIHHFKDPGETPDTQIVTYEYDGLTLLFELALWNPCMKKVAPEERNKDQFPNWPFYAMKIEIYGTKGIMYLGRHSGGWQVFGPDWAGKPFEYGREAPVEHIQNFVDCVRSRKRPNADIEEGHLSTLLCHLGNISHRVGNRRLVFDGETERFVGDDEANKLVKRTYREPYVVPENV